MRNVNKSGTDLVVFLLRLLFTIFDLFLTRLLNILIPYHSLTMLPFFPLNLKRESNSGKAIFANILQGSPTKIEYFSKITKLKII